jgi:hypothetical protein
MKLENEKMLIECYWVEDWVQNAALDESLASLVLQLHGYSNQWC